MWLFGAVRGRATLIALWIASFGCVDVHPDPRLLSGPLLVDGEFAADERAAIEAAVEMWRVATDGRFAPELVFGEVRCGQAFALEAVHDEGCHVGHEVDDTGDRVLGAADRDAHWVSVVTWLEGSAFRDNVAHELGHYLLVGHGDGIMAQARDHQAPRITPDSVSEFCAIWGCEGTPPLEPDPARTRSAPPAEPSRRPSPS
jgi:hypothetical protein